MPRTDQNGRELRQVLAYELNRAVTLRELFASLGISRNYYYTRVAQDDFPNAEECRRLGEHFGLNFIKLLITFGITDEGYILEGLGSSRGTTAVRTRADRQAFNLTSRPRTTSGRSL